MKAQLTGLATLFVLALFAIGPISAASLKSDADYLERAAGGLSAVSPKRAARGYIAAQAYAIARNAAFKRAVRQYAKGKSLKKVLTEARRGGQSWLSGISRGRLAFVALSEMARRSIAANYESRGKKREAQISARQRKGRKLVDARNRARRERRRATGGGSESLSAAGLLAVFLALNIDDPNSSSEVAQQVSSAVNTLESCLIEATDKRANCLANSKNMYESAVCETAFGADSLACMSK